MARTFYDVVDKIKDVLASNTELSKIAVVEYYGTRAELTETINRETEDLEVIYIIAFPFMLNRDKRQYVENGNYILRFIDRTPSRNSQERTERCKHVLTNMFNAIRDIMSITIVSAGIVSNDASKCFADIEFNYFNII